MRQFSGWGGLEGKKVTLGLASVVHSMVTWVLTGAPISWFGMYIIGWTGEWLVLVVSSEIFSLTFNNQRYSLTHRGRNLVACYAKIGAHLLSGNVLQSFP